MQYINHSLTAHAFTSTSSAYVVENTKVVAMDSCFVLVRTHKHGIASMVSLTITDPAFYCREVCKSIPLNASSTMQMLVKAKVSRVPAAHPHPKIPNVPLGVIIGDW